MRELIMFVGLPRSGKSTAAMSQSKIHNAPICNPDSIRLAMHGRAFLQECEPFVWAIAHTMVRSWFIGGYKTVILDATNVTRARRDEWRHDADFINFIVMSTPVEHCLARAAGNEDLKRAIQRMHKNWQDIQLDEGPFKMY